MRTARSGLRKSCCDAAFLIALHAISMFMAAIYDIVQLVNTKMYVVEEDTSN